MRRRRRLFNIAVGAAAAVSLLLCVAIVVIWVRSYFVADYVQYTFVSEDGLIFTSLGGHMLTRPGGIDIGFATFKYDNKTPIFLADLRQIHPAGLYSEQSPRASANPYRWRPIPQRTFLERRGFLYQPSYRQERYDVIRNHYGGRSTPTSTKTISGLSLAAPCWFVAVTTSLLPCALARRWMVRRRRLATGHCLTCGYDLRATPQTPQEGGALLDRCPECGAVATAPPPRTLPTKAA